MAEEQKSVTEPGKTEAGKGKNNFFKRNKVGIIAGGFVLLVMVFLLVKSKNGSQQDSSNAPTGNSPTVPSTGSYVTESELQSALDNLVNSGLKGAKGDKGDKGDKGATGAAGKPGPKPPPPKPKPHHRPPREHED